MLLLHVRVEPLEKLWWAGEVQKKNSCKGILSEKKIHARRVDQKKIPPLAFHTFCTNFKKTGRKAYCVQNISSLNKLPAEFGSYQSSYLKQKKYEISQHQCTYNTGYLGIKGHCELYLRICINLLSHTCPGSLYLSYALD